MSLSELEAYAKERIAAESYPDDDHSFSLFECRTCGIVPFELTIEHHTGSEAGDFKGVITGRCTKCGSEERLFAFTGEHRKPSRRERPVCACGSESFFAGNCERIEGDRGLKGFFDEGVIVGQCSRCGKNHAFVYTD